MGYSKRPLKRKHSSPILRSFDPILYFHRMWIDYSVVAEFALLTRYHNVCRGHFCTTIAGIGVVRSIQWMVSRGGVAKSVKRLLEIKMSQIRMRPRVVA